MKRGYVASSLILTVSVWAFSTQGCNPGQTLQPPPAVGGGDVGVGGEQSGGGGGAGTTGGTSTATANGGGNPNGGTTSGAPTGGNGNPITTGGVPGSPTGGRANATGGYSPGATGGVRPTTGGTTSIVNQPTGGVPSLETGGTNQVIIPTGGTPGVPTGGSAAVGNTGKTVTLSASGKATGAMTGWASVALGASDTITDPTCGPSKTAITKAAPCNTTTNWSTSGVCMTGSIPALPASPTQTDYDNNWGVSVGVGATDPAGNGLGQSFTSVTITVTGSPTTGLRAVVHKKGDGASTTYCAALTSGTAITFTTFAVDCYNGTAAVGPFIKATDVTNIDNISVQVSSTQTAITVTNLCIASITFT